ncbi:MAG: hypothetical protein R2724_10535 [Bryobacterales bacterium]
MNNLFVERLMGGQNAIGLQIRYAAVVKADDPRSTVEAGPWLEIVGVVRDLEPDSGSPLNLDNPATAPTAVSGRDSGGERCPLSRRTRED